MRYYYLFFWISFSFFGLGQSSAPLGVTPAVADSFYFNSNWGGAIPIYQAAIRLGKSHPLLYYRLAVALHQSGRYREAIPYYHHSLAAYPSTNLLRSIQVHLAKVYSITRHYDSAHFYLHYAIQQGYANLIEIETAPDFKNFRTTKEYLKIHDQLYDTTYPCVKKPEARWFDFWVGHWNAYVTGTQNLAGISKIEKIAGECAILENWTSSNGTYQGKSINFYNAATQKWEQHWVGSEGGYQKFEQGEYKDSVMRFTFTKSLVEKPVTLGRFSFMNQGANQVQQLSESSSDGGITWTIDYNFTYIRVPEKIEP